MLVFNAFVLVSDDGGANSVLFFFSLGDGLGVLDVLCFGNVVLFRGLISLANMFVFVTWSVSWCVFIAWRVWVTACFGDMHFLLLMTTFAD